LQAICRVFVRDTIIILRVLRAGIVTLISSGSLASELWSDKRVSVVKRSSSRCEINPSVHQSTIFARTAKRRGLFLILSRSPDSDSVIFRHSTPGRRTDRPEGVSRMRGARRWTHPAAMTLLTHPINKKSTVKRSDQPERDHDTLVVSFRLCVRYGLVRIIKRFQTILL